MFELRPYQKEAVAALVANKRGILKCPAGGGKTPTGAAAIADVYRPGNRVVWVANTKEQVSQAQIAVARHSYPAEFYCYAAMPDLSTADIVVADECHHVGGETFRKPFEQIRPDAYAWGLSATPTRPDANREIVFKLLGPIVHEVPRQLLLGTGALAHGIVEFHQPNEEGDCQGAINAAAMEEFRERLRRYPYMAVTRRTLLKNAIERGDEEKIKEHLNYLAKNDAKEQWNRCVWQHCQRIGFVENKKRNERVVDLMRLHHENGSSILVVVGSIEHGKSLLERSGLPGVMAYSKMGPRKRAEAMETFRSGRNRLIVATTLAEEGLDLPIIDTLIAVGGGRSDRKSEQLSGRALRTYRDKSFGLIHDFNDVQHFFLAAQSKARERLYRSLGYEIRGLETSCEINDWT